VIQELRRRGRARNIEIARQLDLRPSTVGYILYQLRIKGCAKRIQTGLYEFVALPEDLHYWDDGLDGRQPMPSTDDGTMPEKIVKLLASAPKGALSFRAIWKLSGLSRNVTGAVLSDLVKRGVIERVLRGLYALPAGGEQSPAGSDGSAQLHRSRPEPPPPDDDEEPSSSPDIPPGIPGGGTGLEQGAAGWLGASAAPAPPEEV
jgi:hypothetical protein